MGLGKRYHFAQFLRKHTDRLHSKFYNLWEVESKAIVVLQSLQRRIYEALGASRK